MASQAGQPLELGIDEVGDTAVVHVRGSVGMTEADRLRDALADLAERRVPTIILDLGDMDFISSLGLGAIISVHVSLRRHDGQIKLARPQPEVRRLLSTTRLDKLFGVYAGVDEALQN